MKFKVVVFKKKYDTQVRMFDSLELAWMYVERMRAVKYKTSTPTMVEVA